MPKVYCIGMGIETAVSKDCGGLLKAIYEKTTNYNEIDGFNSGKYNCQVAAEIKDYPYKQKYNIIAENAMNQAIHDAGLQREQLKGNRRIGFVFGTSMGNMPACESRYRSLLHQKKPNSAFGCLPDETMHHLAANLCRKIRIKGPCITISNTCATGVNVIGNAAGLINSGQIDACIVGCADVVSEMIFSGMDCLRVLSKKGKLQPFSGERDGVLLGDGAGFLVLCSEDFPFVKKVYGIIDGYAGTSDGAHLTAPDREGRGMALAIERSLEMAAIKPSDVDLIIAGGNGSNYNDAMQLEALKKVWGGNYNEVPITEIKPLTGHTLSAAAMVEAIAVFKMLETGRIIPISGSNPPDPGRQEVLLQNEIPAERIKRVVILSAGFSGANGVLVMRKGSG